MNTDTVLIIFLKFPEKGQVKTRLARDLDDGFVLDLYKGFICDLLEMTGLADHSRIYVWPPEKLAAFRQMINRPAVLYPQQKGHLGEKMAHAFEQTFRGGADKAILIGSDIPEITGDILEAACQVLTHKQAVIGPAGDGGYYLIGFRKESFCADLFEAVDWSGSKVLAQTLSRMDRFSISAGQVVQLEDIDVLSDLDALLHRVKNGAAVGSYTRKNVTAYEKNRYLRDHPGVQ